MRLPVAALDEHVGCNLTTAAMTFNLISGFSLWLFETEEAVRIQEEEIKEKKRLRGRRFKAFIETYWPSISPEPDISDTAERKKIAEQLYSVRNSLAHDLGVDDTEKRRQARSVSLAKHALTLQEIIDCCERNTVHPLVVRIVEEGDTTSVVRLTGLYWALHRMLESAIDDHAPEIEKKVAAIDWPEITETPDSPKDFRRVLSRP
jgi:hypothetical protein